MRLEKLTCCFAGTKKVRVHSYMHSPAVRVHLIDTPGFDDDILTDTDILEKISGFLVSSYKHDVKLNGLLYLHRITDPRMQGSSRKNLAVFKSLCGLDTLHQVTLVTTMWDKESCREQFEEREKELLEDDKFWRVMVEDHGACTGRHDNTRESALHLLERFIQQPENKVVTDLQHELVDEKQPLEKTAAGKTVMSEINKATERVRKDLEQAQNALKALEKKRAMEQQAALEEERARKEKQAQRVEQARAEQAAWTERVVRAKEAAEQAQRAEQRAREEQAARAEEAKRAEQADKAELEKEMAALKANLERLKKQEEKLRKAEVEKASSKWDPFFAIFSAVAAVAAAVIAGPQAAVAAITSVVGKVIHDRLKN